MAIYSTTNIKISKTDANGNDQTSNLENLLYFTLKYSDINPIQYSIISKKEYSDYFLFTIAANAYNQSSNINTLASSSDNNIKNYYVSSSNKDSQPLTLTSSSRDLYFTSSLGNSLNYLNTSSGIYLLGNTPNITLSFTASVTISSTAGALGGIIFSQTSGSIIGSKFTSITALSTASLIFSGSFNPIKNQNYALRLSHDGDPDIQDMTVQSVNFLITQSVTPNVGISSSGDLLILVTPGDNIENPLLNNAENILLNPNYLTLDYTEYKIPDNEFQLVLSGSGTNSNVKQYNYEANRITIPRYRGSKSTSPDWNLNTTEGGLGVSPNVEKNNIYFAAINSTEETSPEILNTSTANLKFLIDDQGNTYELNNDPSNISFYNSTFTFEKDKPIIISDSTGTNYTSSIYKSGFDIIPILHSDMGTYFEPTLSFSSTGVGNYLHNATFQGYGIGTAPYDWRPQIWGSNGNTNPVNGAEGNNNNKNLFLKYPTSASSFDTSLVDILPVKTITGQVINDSSGYQGTALSRFLTGSLYHIKTNRPDTSLKFQYNFYLNSALKLTTYNNYSANFQSLPWKITVSICRDNTSNISTDGVGNLLWDITTPTTQILTKHIYQGNFKTNPYYTDSFQGGSYNPLTNTTIYTFNGVNFLPPSGDISNGIFNSWNNDFTDFWCKIETDYIPDLQIDDIIGINIKIEYPPALSLGTYFSILPTNNYTDYTSNKNFQTHKVFSNPAPSLNVVPSPAPFFTTASGDPYTLIAYKTSASISNPSCTSGLAQAFPYIQLDISESGYKPLSKPSQPMVGDQIRFNYDEATSYDILNIGNNSDGNVTLTLNKPIPDGLNLNWFLIRRYVKNPSKMIINTLSTQTGGFAFPEYMSKNIINNLPKIIEKLKTQGLI